MGDQIKATTAKAIEEQRNAVLTGKLLEQQFHSASRAAQADDNRAEFYKSKLGKGITWLGTAGKELNPFADTVHSARDFLRM